MRKKEGIYQWIQRELEADPEIPYAFQNMMTDGFEDVTGVLFRSGLPFFLLEQMAFSLEKGIRSSLSRGTLSSALQRHLSNAPLYYYLDQAFSRIRRELLSGSMDSDRLYAFGMHLATEESRPEAVKLGMLILGLYENDLTRSVLRTLGLHSDYTLYAVSATSLWKNAHAFLFDLARNTVGYGKLYCIRQFRPASHRERMWLLRDAIDLAADRELAAVYCLMKPDMSQFLLRKRIDSELLEDYSVLICYGVGSSMLPPSWLLRPLVNRYLDAAEIFLSKFIDIAALASVCRSADERITVYEASGSTELESFEQLKAARKKAAELIRSSSAMAEQLLYDELADPYEDSGVLLNTIRVLHAEASVDLPPFSAFQNMLELFGFTGDLLAFFLQAYPEQYLPDLIEIWYDIIPEEIWNAPEAVPDYVPDSEYQADLYTAELLRAMRKTGIFHEELVLDCLCARHQKVRFAAAECIEQSAERSEAVSSAVEKALVSEPDPSVRRLLRHLTGSDDPDLPSFPYPLSPVEVSKQDSVVFRTVLTRVEGIGPRDGSPLPVSEDEPLCIVQHPVHQKVLITRQDGTILGGLPEEDEKFLSLAQESGRIFYAKLEDRDTQENRWSLLIWESVPDLPVRKPDNILPFRRR